ncbi:hypothetical protein OHR68_32765 [Spirillospora sp. NBC_00431]
MLTGRTGAHRIHTLMGAGRPTIHRILESAATGVVTAEEPIMDTQNITDQATTSASDGDVQRSSMTLQTPGRC